MKRFFVAVELPRKTQESLKRITYKLSSHMPLIKWEMVTKYHIMLKLFKTTPVAGRFIDSALREKLAKYPAFPVSFTQLSVLVGKTTCVIAEVERDEMLMRLYHKVSNCLIEQGMKRDKHAYYPHVTMGKTKEKTMNEVPQRLMSRWDLPEFTATAVSLFESRGLNATRYIRLASYPLV